MARPRPWVRPVVRSGARRAQSDLIKALGARAALVCCVPPTVGAAPRDGRIRPGNQSGHSNGCPTPPGALFAVAARLKNSLHTGRASPARDHSGQIEQAVPLPVGLGPLQAQAGPAGLA